MPTFVASSQFLQIVWCLDVERLKHVDVDFRLSVASPESGDLMCPIVMGENCSID